MIEEVPSRIPSVLSRSRSKTFIEPPVALLLRRHTRPQFLTGGIWTRPKGGHAGVLEGERRI